MTMMNMSDFDKSVKKLKENQANTDKLIDQLIRVAVYHSVLNNQATPAIKLVDSFGRSARKNDVISFLVKFSNLLFSKEKGITAKLKTNEEIKACWKDEEKAEAYANGLPAFWDVIKEQKVSTEWDMETALHNLVRAFRRHHSAGHKIVVSEADQEILNALVARFPAKA